MAKWKANEKQAAMRSNMKILWQNEKQAAMKSNMKSNEKLMKASCNEK